MGDSTTTRNKNRNNTSTNNHYSTLVHARREVDDLILVHLSVLDVAIHRGVIQDNRCKLKVVNLQFYAAGRQLLPGPVTVTEFHIGARLLRISTASSS